MRDIFVKEDERKKEETERKERMRGRKKKQREKRGLTHSCILDSTLVYRPNEIVPASKDGMRKKGETERHE